MMAMDRSSLIRVLFSITWRSNKFVQFMINMVRRHLLGLNILGN